MAESQDASLLKRRARRRLIGALALVVFIVVILPLVLDREPRPVTQNLTVQIPSQEAGRFNTRVLPPLAPPPAASTAPAAPAKAAAEAKSETAKPEAAPASKAAPEDRPGAAAKVQTAEAERAKALLNDQAYIVPLGAFSNAANVKQVRDKAAAAGIKSYTEKIKGAKGGETRVRAGPFSSTDAAERAREKLKSLGLPVGKVAQQ